MELKNILRIDPLFCPSLQQQREIWDKRYHVCSEEPESLPLVLSCFNLLKPSSVSEAHHLLKFLEEEHSFVLPLPSALKMLDCSFQDQMIRDFAVSKLENISDQDLVKYSLQLVQALKFERDHFSKLAKFLIQKSIKSELVFHSIFWLIKGKKKNLFKFFFFKIYFFQFIFLNLFFHFFF